MGNMNNLKSNILKDFIKYVSLNIISMIGLSFYILADTLFIANGVGSVGLTALNLVLPLWSLLSGFGLMIGIGGGIRYSIQIGKNNKQNDHLTLKVADNDDIWMHTKNIPGSHVIIKTNGNSVPNETIVEAAMLAAFFSKGKMSSQVPVDYTKKKNIKKPNGAKPGMVIYETNSTVYVTPTEELVARLKIKD